MTAVVASGVVAVFAHDARGVLHVNAEAFHDQLLSSHVSNAIALLMAWLELEAVEAECEFAPLADVVTEFPAVAGRLDPGLEDYHLQLTARHMLPMLKNP